MTTAAVVGCGDISVVHLKSIAEMSGVELVGVCDLEAASAAAAGEQYGVPSFPGVQQLLEQVRPEVVHVCTPHDQHVPVAIACLDAGVHVLVEKPLAHTLGAAEELARVAADHPELKVGVCFQNRYNPTSQALRRLLSTGELGPVLGGSASLRWRRTAEYYRSRPWRGERVRSGGGVLINQAIHTLDLMQWLVGDVTAVRGDVGHHGSATPDIDVEDSANLVLQHDTGVQTLFYATSLNVVDAPITLEVITERATLRLQGDLTVTYADGRVDAVQDAPAAAGVGRSYWGSSHAALITDFYSRLSEPDPFWIGPAEALRTMRLLDKVYALPD